MPWRVHMARPKIHPTVQTTQHMVLGWARIGFLSLYCIYLHADLRRNSNNYIQPNEIEWSKVEIKRRRANIGSEKKNNDRPTRNYKTEETYE